MKPLRISAIAYLNTAPLMWDFEHGTAGEAFDISYTVPSSCAAQLAEGKADIGIIPAAAYTLIANLLVLPEIAIASRQKVRSILLVSKRPVDEVCSVALDTCSLTSVALTKILFAKLWSRNPRFVAMAPNLEDMLKQCDSALLIGDPALRVKSPDLYTYDLAEEWVRWTGQAFVFAFWAVRREAAHGLSIDLAEIFQSSRDHGLRPESLDHIAREWSPRTGLSQQEIKQYLTENIHYYLDAASLAGLELFYRYAHECRCLPSAPGVQFLDIRATASAQ